MSSRQEEKEKRKQERLEREAAAAAAAKRSRLLQIIGGVVIVAAIVAGGAFAISNSGGPEDVDIDAAKLRSAAKTAGCVYRAFPDEGREHEDRKFTPADYKTNPPTSGTHVPAGLEAPDGPYAPGNEPEIGNWVHTLEHGRVLLQYRPGLAPAKFTQLEGLFNEDVADSGNAYHSVIMRNNTKMPFEVAAVAWRHYMGCSEFTPQSIAAMRVFREELIDKGPETVT